MNFDIIKRHISPSSVLDIGANHGWWFEEARCRWPDARYLMIEGNPECESILRERNTPYVIALLSDSEKTVDFWTRKDAASCTGASYMREQTEFYNDERAVSVQIQTRRLDDVCRDAFDLVKIDTQGSEIDVMRGGPLVISTAAAVLLEVSRVEYNKGAPLQDEVVEFMASIGFQRFVDVGEIVHPVTREHIQTDRLFLR